MKKITLLIFLMAVNWGIICGQNRSAINKVCLLNLNLKKQRLSKIVDNQPFVVIFYTAECPICQKYVSTLRGLADCFPSVKFAVVFTKINTATDFQDFVKNTPLSNLGSKNGILPFLDKKNRLAHRLNGTTTPEAFLFDAKGNLKYRGAIDNWFFALGKYREAATDNYLSNAIISLLKNEKINIEKTTPIGCLIE